MLSSASGQTFVDLSFVRNGRRPATWQIELIANVTGCSKKIRTPDAQRSALPAATALATASAPRECCGSRLQRVDVRWLGASSVSLSVPSPADPPDEESDEHEAGGPDDAAGGVVGKKLRVAHARGAGEGGHDGAEEGDEPAEEHGRAAALGEEQLRVAEPVLVSFQRSRLQDSRAEVPAIS